MEDYIVIVSLLSTVLFAAAAGVLVLRFPPKDSPTSRAATGVLIVAMLLFVLVALSNVLEHAGVTAYFDGLEDYAEILFAPLILFSVYASDAQTTITERARTTHLLKQQNEMLMTIVDTSPAGILVLAPGGTITFANDSAKNMLELREDSDTGRLRHADWTMKDAGGVPRSLSDLVTSAPAAGDRYSIRWPDGRRGYFLFTVTPMNDATQLLGGALIAVECVGMHAPAPATGATMAS